MKLKFKPKTIICYVIIVIIICVLSGLFIKTLTTRYGETNYPVLYIQLSNMTKDGDNYTMTITSCTKNLCLTNIEWYVYNKTSSTTAVTISKGAFPCEGGVSGSVSNNSITVTWFDNDNNKFLSANDTIKIYMPNHSVQTRIFALIFIKMESGICSELVRVNFPSETG